MSSLIRKIGLELQSFLLSNPFYTSFSYDAGEVSGGAQRLRRRFLGSEFRWEKAYEFLMSSLIQKYLHNFQMSPLIQNPVSPQK